jgi:hypothetical protein
MDGRLCANPLHLPVEEVKVKCSEVLYSQLSSGISV